MAAGSSATEMESRRPRVLFVGEAVTLAHVARPATLAGALDPAHYDVHFAHCPRYRHLLGELPAQEHAIESIEPAQFTNALARGAPLYDAGTLMAYVEEERELFERLAPDVVVGDFRISLASSAELAGIPCVTLGNACWSPWTRQRYTVPDLPLTRILGPALAQPIFALARPLAFAAHCLPMRTLRRHYGLPNLGLNLRRVYSHGDYTLYADIPGLYDTPGLPTHHRFIGPVPWSPEGELPEWWETLPADKPLIYVTPGSSGRGDLLPRLFDSLASLDVVAMVATAGAATPGPVPDNVRVAPFLPGDAACRRADLVVCNGGSPTTHQALARGRPVLGIAGNMDQFLNMHTLVDVGAGLCLRADRSDARQIGDAIGRLLAIESYRVCAGALQQRIHDCDSCVNFRAFMDDPAAPWWRHAEAKPIGDSSCAR